MLRYKHPLNGTSAEVRTRTVNRIASLSNYLGIVCFNETSVSMVPYSLSVFYTAGINLSEIRIP
jgi:hypothetical protein